MGLRQGGLPPFSLRRERWVTETRWVMGGRGGQGGREDESELPGWEKRTEGVRAGLTLAVS